MFIVSSTAPPSSKLNFKKTLVILFIGFISTAAIGTVSLIIIGHNTNPTGTYISPLPTGELTQNEITPSPTLAPNFTQTINLAQNYLDKAFELAKNQNQTAADKKQIISTLNQSLAQSNTAISLAPQDPQGYLVRAKILTAISKIEPSALAKAQEDLILAQKLSNGEPVTLPTPTNPINLVPDQQAAITGNIIIATPENSQTTTESSQNQSNTATSSVIFLAGGKELVIEHQSVKNTSQIYLIPKQKGIASVYVKSKTDGRFTIAATTAPTANLSLDYWIINP